MQTLTFSRSRWLPFVAAVVGLMLIVACGGGNDSTGSSAQAPIDQQVLRLRVVGEPETIDPALAASITEASLMKPIFAGLFTYDSELRVVPSLASELPTADNGGVSKDGLTYTVKIKKDSKFSDGSNVTANDFVYSLRRALDPKLGSPYVSFFYDVAGAEAYNTAMGTPKEPKTPTDAELNSLRDKVGVEAKDANTVVYHLDAPQPSFLNILALWTAYPVQQSNVEKFGAKWTEAGNIVSNGPFVLREWAHDQRIVFEPNPYWTGEKPKLGRIVINFIADDAAAYAAYQNNELDEVAVPPSVRREAATPGSPLNAEFQKIADLSTFAMFMNNKVAPFDNLKVRQAFAMAVDRNAFVEGVLQGAGVPATSWIPPGMPGYDANLGKDLAFNADKAKQLLADAGYPDGKGFPQVTFLSIASDTNRLIGQAIEDQLKKNLGVTVTTQYVDPKTFGGRFLQNQHQVTILPWSADWPYPDNWLPDQFSTTGLNNHSGYSNAKFDDLVKKAQVETDNKKRLELYGQAQKLILDDEPTNTKILPKSQNPFSTKTSPRQTRVKVLFQTPPESRVKEESLLSRRLF